MPIILTDAGKDSNIQSGFHDNFIDCQASYHDPDETMIYGVSNATVLDTNGVEVFKGDLCIANLRRVCILDYKKEAE